jgi:putative membrane protein
MDRRNMIATLAVATLVPGSAWAQQKSDQAPMGEAEMKHAQKTLEVGSVALATSKIAHKKAQNAWVKRFAQYEIAEQETVAEILTASGVAPAKMSDKHAAAIKKLDEAKADAAFERDYVAAQVDGHKELLKIQEDYIASGKDKNHVNMAKLARGQIKEHIDLLTTIYADLRT